ERTPVDPCRLSRPDGRLAVGDRPAALAGHDPRRPGAMISAATPSVPSDGKRDPTVLVVEEDDAARSFLADNLEADRYRVRTADSREKALAILSVQQPDVIVVEVNGKTLDLIDAIRSGDGLAGRVDPDTPLIVLTTG